MKISDAKAAVYKEWQKVETIPAWQVDKMKSKKDVILELCYVRDSVQLQTVLALYGQENFRSNEQPSHSRLKTSMTRHIH